MTDRARRQSVVGVRPHTRKITKVYLAVTDMDDATSEGVYTVPAPRKERLPVVAIDDKDLEILREWAQSEADATGKTVNIICFTSRSLHEIFHPVTTGDKNS